MIFVIFARIAAYAGHVMDVITPIAMTIIFHALIVVNAQIAVNAKLAWAAMKPPLTKILFDIIAASDV